MIVRRRLKDGRNLDMDMGPMTPHVPNLGRGGTPLSQASPIVTSGGFDWRNGRRSKEREDKRA